MLPKPADDEVRLLLQTVWDLLVGGSHWPTYRTVDRQLWHQQQLNVDTVIARIPQSLLLGGRPQGGAAVQDAEQLRLTVAGAAACAGSGPALEVFLNAVRLAALAELQPLPDGEDPVVTFEQAANLAQVRDDEDWDALARQSGLLLHTEPWPRYVLLHEGGWELRVDRRIRPYADVGDLDSYWAVREQQHAPAVGEPQQPIAVSSSAERWIDLGRRWRIGASIGSGGYGQVFEATGEDGTRAAAKLVQKEPGADREMLFVDLADVRNLIPVIDMGEAEDKWVLVMPRAQQSLRDHLTKRGPLPPDEALVVLRDIATALADLAASTTPVVHRDLKPENVLQLEGSWCLADFGISRYSEAATATVTHKYSMSKPYAAPERWRNEHAESAADVYAVGIIAYELLTGTRPFLGSTVAELRKQHLEATPLRPPGVSTVLAALVMECLEKAPQARPSPANLVSRLEKAGKAILRPGAAALAEAYEQLITVSAERSALVSRATSEKERRAELQAAARRGWASMSEDLLAAVTSVAPGIKEERRKHDEWTVHLGPARLGLSAAVPFDGHAWGGPKPRLDVLAFATLSLVIPPDQQGYEGRSHSLYYCDAQREGAYGWFETAFMVMPLRGSKGQPSQVPFALAPGDKAAQALGSGTQLYQVAWPFTELVLGDLDEFTDRWIGWLALGMEGRLRKPSMIPEDPVAGSWRS